MYDQQCLHMLKDNKNKESWNLTTTSLAKSASSHLCLWSSLLAVLVQPSPWGSLTSPHCALSHFTSPSWQKTVFFLRLAFCWCWIKDQSPWDDTHGEAGGGQHCTPQSTSSVRGTLQRAPGHSHRGFILQCPSRMSTLCRRVGHTQYYKRKDRRGFQKELNHPALCSYRQACPRQG